MPLIPLPEYAPSQPRFRLPSAGSHLATCCEVIHLGTQTVVWQEEERERDQIRLGFELQDDTRDDGLPFVLGRIYTYSWHENAHFRTDMQSWLGRSLDNSEFKRFDLADMIGVVAIIGLTHAVAKNGNTYANITGLMKPPGNVPPRASLISQPIVLAPHKFDANAFGRLPDWLRLKCLDAPQYRAVVNGPALEPPFDFRPDPLHRQDHEPTRVAERDDLDDDLPF